MKRLPLISALLLVSALVANPVHFSNADPPGYWDIDGLIGLYRSSNKTFYLNGGFIPPSSIDTYTKTVPAQAGDKPAMHCDFDAKGVNGFPTWSKVRAVALFRNGTWILYSPTSAHTQTFSYGTVGDTPLCGDWNGDGYKSVGVKRGNVYYLRNCNLCDPNIGESTASVYVFAHGQASDIPVVGDWNNNLIDTIGLFRPSTHTWYLNNNLPASGTNITFSYGLTGDKPIGGDWNNSGGDSVGVVRGNTWYVNNLLPPSGSSTTFSWGVSTDVPMASF